MSMNRNKKEIILIISLLTIGITAIVVLIVFNQKKKNDSSPTPNCSKIKNSSTTPKNSPTTKN